MDHGNLNSVESSQPAFLFSLNLLLVWPFGSCLIPVTSDLFYSSVLRSQVYLKMQFRLILQLVSVLVRTFMHGSLTQSQAIPYGHISPISCLLESPCFYSLHVTGSCPDDHLLSFLGSKHLPCSPPLFIYQLSRLQMFHGQPSSSLLLNQNLK